jgi:hypothetical protein
MSLYGVIMGTSISPDTGTDQLWDYLIVVILKREGGGRLSSAHVMATTCQRPIRRCTR